MKINIFEGARRISKTAMIAVGLGGCLIIWKQAPYVPVFYNISAPGAQPKASAHSCPTSSGGNKSESRELSSGHEIWLNLCFQKMVATDGRLLVPYKETDKAYILNTEYSDAVQGYMASTMDAFIIPKSDESAINSIWWKKKISSIWDDLGILIGILAAIAIFTYITGWIVRGFLGIPAGFDSRPNQE